MSRALLLAALAFSSLLAACGPDCDPQCVCSGEIKDGCEETCSPACATTAKPHEEPAQHRRR